MVNNLENSNDSVYQDLCQKAILACQKSQFEESLAICQEAIHLAPSLAEAYVIQGNTLQLISNFPEAIKAYRQALAINSNIAEVYTNLANIYLHQEKLELAQKNCQKALEISPNLAIAYWTLGHIFNEQEQFEQAVLQWKKGLEIQPNLASLTFYNELCQILMEKEKLDLAIGFYQQAIQVNSSVPELYLSVGNVFQRKGEYYQAIYHYIQALQIQPSLRVAYTYIGQILEQQGRFDEAQMCSTIRLPHTVLEDFYPDAKQLSITSSFDSSAVTVIPVLKEFSNLEYPLYAAKTLDGIPYQNLQDNTIKSPDNFVVIVENGRAWGDFYTSAIFTDDNQLLEDISTGSSRLIASSENLPPVHKIEGKVAFLTVRGVASFYHWMCDLLPRFELIRQAGFSWDSVDYFVINGCNYSFCKETLKILGIPSEKILDSQIFPHIQASQLIIPSLPYGALSRWIVDSLRKEFLSSLKESNENSINKIERLYISRCKADFRRVVNEDEVLNCLQPFGFQSVILETFPFIEQVRLLASAQVIIAPHGAGLTNLIFCNPGTKVIEIFSPNYINNCFWMISNHAHLEYYYLIGDAANREDLSHQIQQPQYLHPGTENMRVKIDDLLEIMSLADISPQLNLISSEDNFNPNLVNSINLIIFPDWNQPEDVIADDLATVVQVIYQHPNQNLIHLWVDSTNIDEQEAQLFISSLIINLLMETELGIQDEPQISMIETLNDPEWTVFLSHLRGRIQLPHENQEAIFHKKAENIPVLNIKNLSF